MNMDKLMVVARQVPGLEDRARKLLSTGHGQDFVIDMVLKEIGKSRRVPNYDLSQIDDDTLVRGLCNPAVEDF